MVLTYKPGLLELWKTSTSISAARTQKFKQLCHSLGLKGQLIGRAAPTRWLSLRKPAERLVRDISRAIFVEDLMQEVALTANKITAMYSGPFPFSALDFPELTAFTNVAGPGSCLVYNGSGHLALQPHGSGSMTVQSNEADSDSDSEEVGSRQAAADMETTFGENEEEEEGSELGSEPVQLYAIPPKGRRAALVPASDSSSMSTYAKGLAIVYAHYWDKQPSDEDFLERLAIVGDVMRGVVTGTAEYGAFVDLVDLPGVTGLVKKAELSWDRLVTADDAVQIGQQVTVKIIGLDAAKGRLTLSIRQLNEDPLKTTLDTVKWGPTKSVPTEVQQLVDRLSRCKGISQVMITRQAQDTHRISQELQVFMTRTEVSDGFVVVARLGPVLQELQLTTSLSRDDVKQILQGIFKDA
ncbi:hypothetical protein QJQ45_011237 [Haematococcus lacustris]|nr:hypothetical protein QJQ45_011237 [Haematococcus lacustris]